MVLAIDLIDKIFNIDQNERITCDADLKHPSVKLFHYPSDEPVSEPFIENDDEMNRLTVNEWKRIDSN